MTQQCSVGIFPGISGWDNASAYEGPPKVSRAANVFPMRSETSSSVQETLICMDMVLLMTVNPGFGGQKFIETMISKISRLREMITQAGLEVAIEVDGGINNDTIAAVAEAGADIFVAGSAVFNTDDYGKTISELRRRAGH